MRAHTLLVVVGLAVSSVASADSDWAAAVGGNWSVASNWSPADVPDTLGEIATISVGPGAYVVVFDSGMPTLTTIAGLVLTNPDARLDLIGGKTLALDGVLTNDGLVRLNTNGSASDTILRFDATTLITGAGAVTLMRSGGDSQVQTGAGAVLTNGASHLIHGQGTLGAALVNLGTVDANTPAGALLLVTNDKSNSGTLKASSSGTLQIDGIVIDNTGGLIVSETGSVVRFPAGTHAVIGGQIDSIGSGIVELQSSGTLTLDGVNSSATFNIHGGGTLLVTGGLTQSGTMTVNNNGSSSDAVVRYISSGTLAGNGTLRMARAGVDSQLIADAGVTLTHAGGHTISGRGTIAASMVNNGLIRSDFSGYSLDLTTYDITNNADIEAVTGGHVQIKSITIDQTGGGRLLGDGGVLRVPAGLPATVTGGDIETLNSGLLQVDSAATLNLVGVQLTGDADLLGGSTVNVSAGLTLVGTVVVNANGSASDSILHFSDSSTVGGVGTILMNRPGADSRMTAEPGAAVTIGADTLVEGRGQIHASLVNNGTIESDFSGYRLELLSNNKTNNALIRATGGGIIEINGITVSNSASGVIHADDASLIDFPVGAHSVSGGVLSTAGSGSVQVSASAVVTLDQVDSSATVKILGGGDVSITGGSLVNDGAIVVNSNGSASNSALTCDGNATITGAGSVLLNRIGADAQLNSGPGATLTIGPDQTVFGSGQINAALVNDGLVDATSSVMALQSEPKTNNALMRASAGAILDLDDVSITQGGAGIIRADAGTVRTQPGVSVVSAGLVESINGGTVRIESSATLTLDGSTLDADTDILGGGELLVGPSGAINDGVIVVNSNSSASDGFVQLSDGSTLGGSGQIVLNRLALDSQVMTAPGEAGTLSGDMRLTGQGRLVGDLTIACILEPGMTSPTTISHSGTMTFDSAGKYRVRIASTSSHGKFDGTADVTLGGTLNPVFESGYTPAKNHFFTIITAGSVAGEFDAIDAPSLPGDLVYRIVKTPTSVDLRITCGPDLNADGLLDFFDVQFFLQAFSSQDPLGDFNEDGRYDFFDVQAFLNAFSTGCP